MDNDAKMLELMGNALTALQVKYRTSGLRERKALKPELDRLLREYAAYQGKLLEEGTICSDGDLQEMAKIKTEIDSAAQAQQLAAAIAKTIGFIATKV